MAGGSIGDTYDVDPGFCVIINNMEFIHAKPLPGGEKDEEKLEVLFAALGFEVKIHRNLTAEQIFETVESYGTKQHSGAFFLIILSHGTSIDNQPAVISTDNRAVVVSDLESFFYASNCNSLHGRPKIFLIDACRGSQIENIFTPVSTKTSSASLARQDSVATRSDSADFLIINAATNGNVAFTTDKGSYLTQMFVEVTSKAGKTDSLRDIVTRVRDKIQDRDPHQTVEATDRLTRKYLIKRGRDSQNAQRPSSSAKPNATNLTVITWKNERGEEKKFRLKQSIMHRWRNIGDLVVPRQLLAVWANERDANTRCTDVLSYWMDHPPSHYPATWEGLYNLLNDSELSQVAIDLKQAVDNAI